MWFVWNLGIDGVRHGSDSELGRRGCVCGSSGLPPFSPMFTHPGLECDALSISGVRNSQYSDSLTEGKKIDTDTFQAMDLPFTFWTTPDNCHGVELIGSCNDLSRVWVGVRA